MANGFHTFTALEICLTCPRLGFVFDRDTVLFTNVFDSVAEPTLCPEVVCSLVHTSQTVNQENVLDVADD